MRWRALILLLDGKLLRRAPKCGPTSSLAMLRYRKGQHWTGIVVLLCQPGPSVVPVLEPCEAGWLPVWVDKAKGKRRACYLYFVETWSTRKWWLVEIISDSWQRNVWGSCFLCRINTPIFLLAPLRCICASNVHFATLLLHDALPWKENSVERFV